LQKNGKLCGVLSGLEGRTSSRKGSYCKSLLMVLFEIINGNHHETEIGSYVFRTK